MPSLIGNKPNQVPSNGDLGTLAFQDANAVNITGGSINGTTVGASTANTGAFTTITGTNDASISGLTVGKGGGAVASNTALGSAALFSNTTASGNTAVGYQAGYSNTTGAQITAIGYQALYSNTTGNFNVALGYQSLLANTTGAFNHGLGRLALSANTTGQQNVAVGNSSLSKNTTGSFNIGIGSATLAENLTTSSNVAIGQNSMNKNVADNNTAVGAFTLDANTTGTENSAFGNFSLSNSTTGSYNTALGSNSLLSNTTASNNTAVGYQAGYSNTTALYNSYFGYQAGYSMTVGNGNTFSTFLGERAGYSTTGYRNTFVGGTSGYDVTTGNNNTILGRYSGNQGGLDIRTASNYIVLSDGDGNPRVITDNLGRVLINTASQQGTSSQLTVSSKSGTNSPVAAWIGNQYSGDTGNAALYLSKFDNDSTTSQIFARFTINNVAAGSGQINANGASSAAFGTFSDIRLKENIVDLPSQLEKIASLRPVEFDYKDGSGHQIGFIAQEMQEVYPDVVGKAEGDMFTVTGWSKTEARLVKAIQELNAKLEAQALEIKQLKGA